MNTPALRRMRLLPALLPAALLSASPALAGDGECMTGCPSFELSAGYTADFRRNTTGGVATGNATSGLLELGGLWTTDRLLPGAMVTTSVSLIHAHGGEISGQRVGDLQGLNNIEAPNGLRMYEFWSEISFGEAGKLSSRIGLLDLNAEFDAPVTSAFFIGPPFGIGTDLAQTGENGPAVYPVTSLGVRFAGKAGEAITWRAAAFDGVPGRVDSNSFQSVNVSGKQGALLIGELELAPKGFNKVAVGAWSYTASFARIDADASGDDTARKGNRGAYAMADWPVSRGDAAHLDAMLRVGVADGSFNAVDTYVGGAMVASHFISSRPDDAVGLAFAYGRTGNSFKRALAFDGGLPRNSETAVELTYRTPVLPWLAIVPSMQWVMSPGADRNLRNAWVVGARFEMSFGHSWPVLARQSGPASNESLANVIP